MNVLYICDGKNIHCSKTWCKYNGTGECKHTMSEFYAKYGAVEQITADRFIVCDDTAIEIDREDSQQKMGRWERDQFTNQPTCSKCGYKVFGGQTNYCPACGSKNIDD